MALDTDGVGGPDRDRTGDLVNAIHARSQLRYWPTWGGLFMVAHAHWRGNPRATSRGKTFPVTARLYCGCAGRCCRREALVRQRQPLPQVAGGFVGRLAIKRHHGRRHARAAAQLRPPTVADQRDLDLVRATANGFFEVMNDQIWMSVWNQERRRFYASARSDQAKRHAKGVSTAGTVPDRSPHAQKKISLSGSPQLLHVSSTGFPQHRVGVRRCHDSHQHCGRVSRASPDSDSICTIPAQPA